jgi:type IV secretory pathway TrbD component
MPVRSINLRALGLCLLVVVALGYAILMSTLRYRPGAESAALRTVEFQPLLTVPGERIDSAPPPPARATAPAAEPISPAHLEGPHVAPSAAPGVAFAYRYAFQLPASRVSEVQEHHAGACERLGVHRCRVTGMRFRVAEDRTIAAMLTVKLEPSLARRFGRSATETVRRAEGMLIESDIAGSDVEAGIRSSTRDIARMREDLLLLERRVAAAGERDRLIYEAQRLRQSIAAAEAGREDQQESLATTPMVFEYAGAEVPAAAAAPSVSEAAERAFSNFGQGAAIVAIILVTLLPWALAGLLIWFVARFIARRSALKPAAQAAADA